MWIYPTVKKFEDVFSRFDSTSVWQTDRQMDRHLATA